MKITINNARSTLRSCDSKLGPFGLCSKVLYSALLVVICFAPALAGAEGSLEQADPVNPVVPHPNGLGTASTNLASQINEPEGGFTLPKDPNNRFMRELWRARISIADDQRDTESTNSLSRLIARIRSVVFKPKKITSEPLIIVEPVPTTQKEDTLDDVNAPAEPGGKLIEAKLPFKPIADKTLQMLKSLSQDPNNVRNPFELAEILFVSQNHAEAVKFYRVALNRKDLDKAESSADGAWILFQMANCLRSDDPPAAAKMYTQLITEYPNSPWTDLAKARGTLIDWYQKDNPQKLITESKLSASMKKVE